MDFTDIIKAVIALAVSCITAFVVPWLKTKLDTEDMERLESLVRIGVYAAEQLYSAEQWQEKKSYVRSLLRDRGYEVDTDEVDAAIEAAVLALHKQIREGAV